MSCTSRKFTMPSVRVSRRDAWRCTIFSATAPSAATAAHRRRNLHRAAAGLRNRGGQGAIAAAVQARGRRVGLLAHAGRQVRTRVQDLTVSRTDAVTRILFESFSATEVRLFYLLGYAAIAVFCYGVYVQIRKYRRGAQLRLGGSLGRRLGGVGRGGWGGWRCVVFSTLLSPTTQARRAGGGGGALGFFFYGFMLLFAGT